MIISKKTEKLLRKFLEDYELARISGESNMDRKLVIETFNILTRKLGDIVNIEDGHHYLWLYRKEGDMIGIVHGGIGKPFEFKVINVGEYKQKDYTYDNWKDFKYFLENELRSHILALAL